MSVAKTITTSKPFYVVAGIGDLAVKALREGAERVPTVRIERQDLDRAVSQLKAETLAVPARTQTIAVTVAADVAEKVGTGYDDLVVRGRSVVTRIRRQKSTQELERQAATTVRRSKAAVTTAREAFDATRTSAKGTTTTARKRTAATKKTAKSATTSAKKTARTASKAVADGADKTGR